MFRLSSGPAVWLVAPPTTTRGRQVDGYLAGNIMSWKPQVCVSSGLSQIRAPFLENINKHSYFYLSEDFHSIIHPPKTKEKSSNKICNGLVHLVCNSTSSQVFMEPPVVMQPPSQILPPHHTHTPSSPSPPPCKCFEHVDVVRTDMSTDVWTLANLHQLIGINRIFSPPPWFPWFPQKLEASEWWRLVAPEVQTQKLTIRTLKMTFTEEKDTWWWLRSRQTGTSRKALAANCVHWGAVSFS